MNDRSVATMLFLTVLVVAVAPLVAAFYLLEHTLQTSLNLGFNPQVATVLDASSQNLKTLRRLDEPRQEIYREQFQQVESLKQVYADPQLVKSSLQGSLKIYFGVGLLAAVLASVLIATLLSRRIATTYRMTFAELQRERERARYLEEMSSWQELAKMLAHEIKNPLTPIEVLVSSLSRAYLSRSSTEFQKQLSETQTMINEELAHLKNTVNRFSEFARLPQVQLGEERLADVIRPQLQTIGTLFEQAQIDLAVADEAADVRARVDTTLFRQVLTNVIRNGVEANPNRRVRFDVTLRVEGNRVLLTIANDGEPVAIDIAPRIFDPYISSKHGGDNMGLGLAIVKKIVIEHGGEIAYLEARGHPSFTVTLPRAA